MVAKPVISAVRVTLMGSSIMAFAFAAVSIPVVNKAAVATPSLPPPIKVVYRTARNPFTLDEIGEEGPTEPGGGTTNANQSMPSQIRDVPPPAIPFPSIPGDLSALPKGSTVPSIAPLAGSVQLTGIIYGDEPLAMVVDGSRTRTVGIGDSVNGRQIVGITANEVLLSGGARLRPGVGKVNDKSDGFQFPSTVPNGDNKGQLVPTIANPNAVYGSDLPLLFPGQGSLVPGVPALNGAAGTLPQLPAVPTQNVNDQNNALQRMQNLVAPPAAPVATPAQN